MQTLRVQPVAAGYGGVGPQIPPPNPDTWIVVFLDLEATTELIEVEVRQLELLDAAGNPVTRARGPWSLRRDTTGDDAARRRGDFSEVGTVPFDGTLSRGTKVRLRIHAPLEMRSPVRPEPARFRAVITASGEAGTQVEGPLLGPWATG